jgi:hypothetical protein
MASSTVDVMEDAARVLARMIGHGAGLGRALVMRLAGPSDGRCACGSHGDCAVPAPCWEPQPLGEVVSSACPGGVASVRIRITNCSSRGRDVAVQPVVKRPGLTVVPESIALAPYERGFVTASMVVPSNAAKGEEHEVVLMVRGCRDYFLRWTVWAGRTQSCSCDTVDIEDGLNEVHHWYDHFHCHRSCAEGR